jgi:DNA replication initiation complex subunit (GINS family)
MAEEIAITFETLYDILRREKSKEELQELKNTFFLDVVSYLKGKQSRRENKEGLFADMKSQQQNENIRRIIRDIYDAREKKIIELARDVSRTGTNLINMKALLPEEEKMYKELLSLFDMFRNNILHRVLLTEVPSLKTDSSALKTENSELTAEPKALKREAKSSKRVRFLEPVSQFVGPDLEQIGPFSKDDIAELPEKVAEALLNKKSAVEE